MNNKKRGMEEVMTVIPREPFYLDGVALPVTEGAYQRFPVNRQAFVTVGQKDTGCTGLFHWTEKMARTQAAEIEKGTPGKTRADVALDTGAGAVNGHLAMYGLPNNQALRWQDEGPPVSPVDMEPEALTEFVKKAAHLYGSDLTGIAALDRRWVYAQDLEKEFVFSQENQPRETDTAFMIPDSISRAVVLAVTMNPEQISTSPAVLNNTATEIGYSRMAALLVSLAASIRALGYLAIPTLNDTALSIPLAVAAGLGEPGRNGLLLTPEFGACIRLGKVLTNMPLLPERPVDFGLRDFCLHCQRCAHSCPAGAVSEGAPGTATVCSNNQPGVHGWYVHAEKCLRFWQANGTSCASCIAACPFTTGKCGQCTPCRGKDTCTWTRVIALRQEHGYGRTATDDGLGLSGYRKGL